MSLSNVSTARPEREIQPRVPHRLLARVPRNFAVVMPARSLRANVSTKVAKGGQNNANCQRPVVTRVNAVRRIESSRMKEPY